MLLTPMNACAFPENENTRGNKKNSQRVGSKNTTIVDALQQGNKSNKAILSSHEERAKRRIVERCVHQPRRLNVKREVSEMKANDNNITDQA